MHQALTWLQPHDPLSQVSQVAFNATHVSWDQIFIIIYSINSALHVWCMHQISGSWKSISGELSGDNVRNLLQAVHTFILKFFYLLKEMLGYFYKM
jgi:succinate dehydrogenase hydrophobic anchor subunit